MQRYRVNYRLLAVLVIAMVVAAPAAYGLWWYQVDRNAARLLAEADIAEEKGDYRESWQPQPMSAKARAEAQPR